MNPSHPEVSVVICVIDPHPRFFRKAVHSILNQTFMNLELIVVEAPRSCGLVGSPATLPDPRVRHFHHEGPTSLIEQRNRGIALARAPLVALLDADDLAEPTRIEKQARFMAKHPEVGVLGTQLQLIGPDDEHLGYRHYPTDPQTVATHLKRYNAIAQPSVMYRRALMVEAGGYGYGSHRAEDYELWCRLSRGGVRIANLDEVLVRYRIHPGASKLRQLRSTLWGTIEVKRRHFRGELGVRARARLVAEYAMLALPPSMVFWLFLALTRRRTMPDLQS